MPDTAPGSTPPSRNQILEDAWFRFAKYDKNASIAQKRFIQQRRWILILGVAATTLGISYSVIEPYLKAQKEALLSGVTNTELLSILHVPVLTVPIVLGVLVAISVKFNMGISWVMLRSSAEAIKKEIYRYRMQVGEYNPARLMPAESRDIRLAYALKLVSKRLMQTPVNQTDLIAYEGSLPPTYGTSSSDNGFSDLKAEDYLLLRVEDQFSYYQKKAARLGKNLRRFQLVIFLLSAIGTLLAGLGFDVWIAVSSALAAAVTAYLEFRRVETNVVSCNITASDLYDIRIWWHALSLEARTQRANIETLVATTEAVLQTENAGWLQEMREALADIYGDKKEKDAYDDPKRLDDIAPILQPSPIVSMPKQDSATLKQPGANTTEPVVEPKPHAAPMIQKGNSDVAQSLVKQPAETIATPFSTTSASEAADYTKLATPDLAVDIVDPTAIEASR